MDANGILDAAGGCGFRDLDAIRRLTRPAAILRPHEAPSSPVQSRIGGPPTLPPGIEWPRHNGLPLAFIAQIDLASQPQSLADDGLPTDGRLLFFYDAQQTTWGFDPKDAGSFAVIHVDNQGSAAPARWPDGLPSEARFSPVALGTEGASLLPPWESVLVGDLKLADDQREAYQDLLEQVSPDEWASRCILAGYPDQIQGDMSLEAAMVGAGLYCGDGNAYKDSRMPVFRRQARDWRLLLQVASLESAGMMWGDLGCLYYWIRDEDLRSRRFDRAWMILQCS